jgi:hypothetical protein
MAALECPLCAKSGHWPRPERLLWDGESEISEPIKRIAKVEAHFHERFHDRSSFAAPNIDRFR